MKENQQMSLTQFIKCRDLTLNFEGRIFEDDPNDQPTLWGLVLDDIREYHHDQTLGVDALKNLTPDTISEIYHTLYWIPLNCDRLPLGLDFAVYDYGVNVGIRRAVKILQQAVEVNVDGVIGNQTLAAISNSDVRATINKMADLQTASYRSFAKFPIYGNGWLNRVDKRQQLALNMLP